MTEPKLVGSYTGQVTLTKPDAANWKIRPMLETVTIRGVEGNRVEVSIKREGVEPIDVPEDEATEVARELLSFERIKHANLNLGPDATIVWKHYRYITVTPGEGQHTTMLKMCCGRCGSTEWLALPITAGQLHEKFAPFGRAHEGCEVEP